jgi:predicted Zn-dependent peptidase/LysM repeat protein
MGLATLLLALLLPRTLWAQAAAGTPSNSLVPLSESSPSQRITLDNGLKVVARRAQGSGLAAVCVSYRGGSRNEGPGQRGLAQMVQSLMSQGSRNLGPDDASRLVSERGGIVTSNTTSDVSQFCSQLPASDLSLALWMEADRMKNLSATAQAFAVQRDLLLMQLTTRASSDQHGQGLQRLTQLAYQDYPPYQSGVLDSSNDLQSLTLQDARDFHWRYYTPGNAVVSVVADLDTNQSIDLVSKYFSSAPNRHRVPAPLEPHAEPRQSSERLSVHSDDNCLAPGVYNGFRAPRVGSDGHRVVQLLAVILGGSDAARLPQSLVADRASALRAKVWLWGNDAADLLAIYAAVAPLSSVDKVQEVIDAELKRLRFFGPSMQEVEDAKASILNELLRRSENTLQLASWLGQRETAGVTLDLADELEAFQAITPDDVRRVAQQYLAEHKRSIVELYPPGWPQDEAPLVVVLKYSVKRGDNLEVIARRYGSSVTEIVRVSGIDPKRPIRPGQVLKVPVVGGKVPAAPAAMRSHKVRPGDSLSVIAQIYGTTVTEIVRLNDLDRNRPIMVGQKLIIPPKQPNTDRGTAPSKAKTATAPATKSGAASKPAPATGTQKPIPATTSTKKKK